MNLSRYFPEIHMGIPKIYVGFSNDAKIFKIGFTRNISQTRLKAHSKKMENEGLNYHGFMLGFELLAIDPQYINSTIDLYSYTHSFEQETLSNFRGHEAYGYETFFFNSKTLKSLDHFINRYRLFHPSQVLFCETSLCDSLYEMQHRKPFPYHHQWKYRINDVTLSLRIKKTKAFLGNALGNS